jgi:hypothetical protein
MSQSTDASTGHVVQYGNTEALPNMTEETVDEFDLHQLPDVVGLPDSMGDDIASTKKPTVRRGKLVRRFNRLKRSSNAQGDVIDSKRLCQGDSRSNIEVNAETIRELDPHLSIEEVNSVLNDYKHARRILNAKPSDRKEDTIPTLEFMIGLVNDWRPKTEMICMYVRWSKRLRRNFHLDSISTLLCVAKQCDYKPYVFLKSIKTLSIMRSSTMYRLNFRFDTANNNTIDSNKLNEKFLGLSITLRLLQEAVVPCTGTLGTIGLRKSTKKARTSEEVLLGEFDEDLSRRYSVADNPTSRFHTTNGLNGRIWMAIQHRWIALQVVEALFPVQLARAKSAHESLAYSFQMHASAGPSRFDYLDPIIGFCLRYRSSNVIDNHSEILESIWNDPKSFVPFGNRLLQGVATKERIKIIAETFQHLYSLVETGKVVILHKKTDNEDKWQMICGYAFHFWLERGSNKELQDAVDCLCSKKTVRTTTSLTKLRTTYSTPVPKSSRHCQQVDLFLPSNNKKCSKTTFNNVDAEEYKGGLSRLITSQDKNGGNNILSLKKSILRDTAESENIDKVTTDNKSTKSPNLQADGSSLYKWDSIRLASPSEITSLAASHLLIHRDDGVTIVEELSPLEVYSADMLYKYRHSRQSGKDNISRFLKHNGVVVSYCLLTRMFNNLLICPPEHFM